MPEWCFEFLEGPITEMRPTEPRQAASGVATRRQSGERKNGEGGRKRERSVESTRQGRRLTGEG